MQHRLHLLVPGDLDACTGGYRYDRQIVRGLRMLGWEVNVVALDASFPTPSSAARADASAKVAAIDDDERVLIDGLALGAMPETVERHRQRLRLIGLVHHPLADETGLSARRSAALRASESRALAAMRRVAITSSATASRLEAMGVGVDRLCVIEPGTDPAPLARRLGQKPIRLLCVGALIPRKGHRFLLEALAATKDLSWTLDLVGSLERDPDTAQALRAQIQALGLDTRVQVRGELDEDALQAVYQQADLFVLPSLLEGYGMAFSEALARGLPILGSGAGAVSETVPSDAGLLVETGSSTALAGGLRRLLSDPSKRAELAAGAERARKRLPNWSSQSQRWVELLDDV